MRREPPRDCIRCLVFFFIRREPPNKNAAFRVGEPLEGTSKNDGREPLPGGEFTSHYQLSTIHYPLAIELKLIE
jgi:hypothetical protein